MMIGVGAFGLLQLAEDDGAGILQPRNYRCILGGTEISMNRHAMGRRRALGPAEILDRHWHTMQRPLDLAGSDLLLGRGSVRERRVSHHISETLELAVELLDPPEHRFGRFDRRQLLRLDLPPDVDESEIVEICCRHRSSSSHSM
ncbi:hypothetical protein ABIF79_002058 [Bradyrhizobium japonicum]